MTARQWIYLALLIPFLAQTGYVLATAGFGGFYAEALSSPSTVLMGMDLFIALGLVLLWMAADARSSRTPLLPYVAVTLAIGVAGPLAYLIHREASLRRRAAGLAPA